MKATVGTLLQAWTWACDAAQYPGLASAPRDPTTVLPRPVVYSAGPAPTLAECDAALPQLVGLHNPRVAMLASMVARYTGLRIGQVLRIRAATLTVRVGKSAREKAERRTVPVTTCGTGSRR